jgi:hypothetical protein
VEILVVERQTSYRKKGKCPEFGMLVLVVVVVEFVVDK